MDSRTERMRRAGRLVLCSAALAAAIVRAQPDDSHRPDFSGTWTLDRDLSTDPAQIEFVPGSNSERRPQRGRTGGFGGFGRGRQGADMRSASAGLTPLEQERLKALTDQLKTSAGTIVISHHDPDFVV